MKVEAQDFSRGDPIIGRDYRLTGIGANDDDQELQDSVLPGFAFRVTKVEHFVIDHTAVCDYEVSIADEPVTALVAGTPVADGGNTGDGTPTVNAVGAKTKLGDCVLTCLTEEADGGTFEMVDPDGDVVLDVDGSSVITVGVAFVSEQLSVTIADGAADWDEDDFLTVTTRSAITPADATRATAGLRDLLYLEGSATDVIKLKTTADSGGACTGMRVTVSVEPTDARPVF